MTNNQQRDAETMAERFHQTNPVNATLFIPRFVHIDRNPTLKSVDNDLTIFFSDGSSYRISGSPTHERNTPDQN